MKKRAFVLFLCSVAAAFSARTSAQTIEDALDQNNDKRLVVAVKGEVPKAGFLVQPSATGLWASLLLLVYPAILALPLYVVWSKRPALWTWYALHLLVIASFAAVCYPVLNGYDFMVG